VIQLQQGDTAHPIDVLLTSSTDHITGLTGATPTVTRSKSGGAFAAITGTVAEVGNGVYKITPAAGDVDTLGELALHVTAAGADPADLLRQVVAFNPYAVANLGLTDLDAAVSSRLATSGYTAPDNADIATILTDVAPTAIAGAVQTGLTSQGYTTVRAGYLDTLNGLVTAVWAAATRTLSAIANVTVGGYATGQDPATLLLATPANKLTTNSSGQVQHDLTQAVPNTPTQGSVGDALLAAEAQGVGKWTLVGTTLTLYRHDGTTVARTFTLDSGTAPTQRT
jgi:hypothetical protein